MATTTLPYRLRQVMRFMDWNQADLADAAEASKQAASGWMRDGGKSFRARFAFNLQHASGFCAEWLMYGTGPERVSEQSHEFPDLHAAFVRFEHEMAGMLRAAAAKK